MPAEPHIPADLDAPEDLPENSLSSYDPQDGKRRIPAAAATQLSVWSLDKVSIEGESPRATSSTETIPVYRLDKLIGEGGMGEVYEAVQASLQRVVAVKRLKDKLLGGDEDTSKAEYYLRGFRQEALTTANLDHPNILPVYDYGADESGLPLLAMKRIHGDPWPQLIRRDRAELGAEEFLARHIAILSDVTQAVAFAHSRGVVHRDLKPGQVMVGEFGEVLLADWGLSVIFDADALRRRNQSIDASELPTLESASSPAGTPAFMAPEQTERSCANIGPWTDVYLLGGTLYFLLTGRPPHVGKTAKETFLRAHLGNVAHPSKVAPRNAKIPEDLAELALKSMRPEHVERPQSASEFLDGLNDYLTGASRRRESVQLATEVASAISAGCNSYEAFSDHLGKLARAEALWPANENALHLRCEVHAAFAKLALENGDLQLAEVQGRSIRDPKLSDEIQKEAVRRRKELESRERHRRKLRIALRATVAVAAVGAAFFIWRIHLQRTAAMDARELARTEAARAMESADEAALARDEAQKLVNFVMSDLLDMTGEVGQLEALEGAARSVVEYYDRTAPEALSPDAARQQAAALLNLAIVEVRMGASGAALDTLVRYRAFAERLHDLEPDAREWRSHLIFADGLSSRVLASLGRTDQSGDALASMLVEAVELLALDDSLQGAADRGWFDADSLREALLSDAGTEERLAAAERLADQIAGWGPGLEGVQLDFSYPYFAIAVVREAEQNHAEARRLLRKSLELLEKTDVGDSLLTTRERRIVETHLALGRISTLLRDGDAAAASYRDASVWAKRAAENNPRDPRALLDVSRACSLEGLSRLNAGDAAPVVLPLVEEGRRIARYLSNFDPENTEARHNLMQREADMMEALLASGDGDAAATAGKAAVAAAEDVVRQSSDNRWSRDTGAIVERVLAAAQELGNTGKTEPAIAIHRSIADVGLRNADALRGDPRWDAALKAAQQALNATP